jgi:hypothetical protein
VPQMLQCSGTSNGNAVTDFCARKSGVYAKQET